jgi:hypothetical protein
MKRITLAMFAACSIAASLRMTPRASAQEGDTVAPASRFGGARQWALSNDSSFTIQRATQSEVDGAVVSVTLAPAADYFLIRNLSLGGFAGVRYTKAGDADSLRFDIGPRVGYNIPMSDRWSLWPKLGFSYARTKNATESEAMDDTTIVRKTTQNALALNLFIPVLFHPVSHFFLGFGPFIDTDLNGDNRATVWGGKLTMGGWVGGGA